MGGPYKTSAGPDLGASGSSELGQVSPLLDPTNPDHYEMGCNGNYNSGAAAIMRYPRMSHEIGGMGGPRDTGADRIQLEHDDFLIHRR